MDPIYLPDLRVEKGAATDQMLLEDAVRPLAVKFQVSPEAILDADPDVLLYAGSAADRDELIGRPGWSEMRAVKTQRTYTVSRAELLIPGPRVVDGIEHLAALLHPVAAVQ